MQTSDLSRVNEIAARVHPTLPEDAAVFAERLRLYPQGCHVLLDDEGTLQGYIISHPWGETPPALDSLLRRLPAAPTTYYLHDIALLPGARGRGAAVAMVGVLIEEARRCGLADITLVAVGGSAPFWRKLGFREVGDAALAAKLHSYGDEAHLMRRAVAPFKAPPEPSVHP